MAFFVSNGVDQRCVLCNLQTASTSPLDTVYSRTAPQWEVDEIPLQMQPSQSAVSIFRWGIRCSLSPCKGGCRCIQRDGTMQENTEQNIHYVSYHSSHTPNSPLFICSSCAQFDNDGNANLLLDGCMYSIMSGLSVSMLVLWQHVARPLCYRLTFCVLVHSYMGSVMYFYLFAKLLAPYSCKSPPPFFIASPPPPPPCLVWLLLQSPGTHWTFILLYISSMERDRGHRETERGNTEDNNGTDITLPLSPWTFGPKES